MVVRTAILLVLAVGLLLILLTRPDALSGELVLEKSNARKAPPPQADIDPIHREQEALEQLRMELETRAARAVPKIRRLPVDAFPELPPAVADILHARECTVPQHAYAHSPNNVIRGEFFAKGQSGWAVLCSVNYRTSLLVFRHNTDADPLVLLTNDDANYADTSDENQIFYSQQISAVGEDFIMGHYRAYGGPEPPPITHHGIDDVFLEKASITWYFHEGKWLRLTGAD